MNDKMVLTLIDRFNDSSVAELDLDDGSTHLILRKYSNLARPAVEAGGSVDAAVPTHKTDTAQVRLGMPMPSIGADGDASETIISPIVATFYATPGADSPAFVSVGSKVKAGDTLCILEAMKMMNHLQAEFDCEILAVKAANGDMVEYGQTLFEIKRL
ncbi:hypothetical protein AGMMS50212_02780 [Spirochaetia bacterium]|nr:hypothetical protein AGMMS50212_02780 [Spirochaetia bacterium]